MCICLLGRVRVLICTLVHTANDDVVLDLAVSFCTTTPPPRDTQLPQGMSRLRHVHFYGASAWLSDVSSLKLRGEG